MTKRLRYQVAASLDGFIADPHGGYDWIVADPTIDFGALFKEFDTAVMGRKTYDLVKAQGGNGAMPGLDVVVFSRTLPSTRSPGVRVVSDDPREVVADIKAGKGRDIWLFGGGELFRYLLDAGLVDTVEVAVMPVLLGEGIPLLPPGVHAKLVLSDLKRLPSGIVMLAYSVIGSKAAAPKIRYSKSAKARKSKPTRAKRKR
jgi:dihydrofolate reductase